MMRMQIFLLVTLLSFLGSLHASPGPSALRRHYYQERSEDASLPFLDRVKYLDSLLALTDDPAGRKDILLSKVRIYHESGLMGRALNDCEELMQNLSGSTVSEQCLVLYRSAQAYFYNTDYTRSMENAMRLIDLGKPDSLKYYHVLAHVLHTDIYNRLEHKDMAARHIALALAELNKSRRFYPAAKGNELMARIHGVKSTMYIIKGEYEKAFTEFKAAESITDNLQIRTGININRAQIYTILKEYAIAENYYRKILTDISRPHYFNSLAVLSYMDLLTEQHRYQDAIDLFYRYQHYVDMLKGDLITGLIYRSLAQAYEHLGDYRQAYSHLQASALMGDSISQKEKEVLIQARDLERREEKKTRQLYTRRADIATGAAAGIAVLCAACAVAIWLLCRRMRKARTRNDHLAERIAGMEEQYKGAFRESEQAIESKDRELTSLAMQISQISESVKASQGYIADRALSPDEKLRAVDLELKKVDMHGDVWKMFEKYFGQTHQRFIHNLCAAHPDLTNGEVRLCTFIILNLNTKDIAAITNRGIRAVDTAKYRLHKKLGCEESTYMYLQKFL